MESVNRKYTVTFSDRASEMLLSHARFLATVNEEAAKNFIMEFKITAKSLESLPDRGPWLTDLTVPVNKYLKLLFSKRYLLLYQIKKEIVYIDYIVDCRQDYGWLI